MRRVSRHAIDRGVAGQSFCQGSELVAAVAASQFGVASRHLLQAKHVEVNQPFDKGAPLISLHAES